VTILLKLTIRRVLWTFRRNISPPSSEQKSTPSMKQAGSSDLSDLHGVTTHKTVLFGVQHCLLPVSAGILPGLIFDPEGDGDMFLRNVGLSPNYTELQQEDLYSSQSPP
jgi:hypothetical protein